MQFFSHWNKFMLGFGVEHSEWALWQWLVHAGDAEVAL